MFLKILSFINFIILFNQSPQKKNKGVIQCTKEIYQKEGIMGLFSGVGSSLILIVNPIVNYVIYEYLKKFFKGQILILFFL